MGPGVESPKVHHEYKVFDLDPELLTERKVLRVSVSNAEGPPVPIPNTEVKLCSGENTLRATVREDSSMPTQWESREICSLHWKNQVCESHTNHKGS